MTNENALRLADQTILQLRKHKWTLCVWLSRQGDVVRTPNTDRDVAYMEDLGAALVGVFTPAADRQHLAETIMEVAGEAQHRPIEGAVKV